MFENILAIGGGVVACVVAAAPGVTVAVNTFGSPKVKVAWGAVRRVYNRRYAKRVKDGIDD